MCMNEGCSMYKGRQFRALFFKCLENVFFVGIFATTHNRLYVRTRTYVCLIHRSLYLFEAFLNEMSHPIQHVYYGRDSLSFQVFALHCHAIQQ